MALAKKPLNIGLDFWISTRDYLNRDHKLCDYVATSS